MIKKVAGKMITNRQCRGAFALVFFSLSFVYGEGGAATSRQDGDLVRIRNQFVEYYAGLPVDDAKIEGYVDALSEEGIWPDINYASTRRGGWEVWGHMTRIVSVASAYVNPESSHYKKPKTRDAILRALQHWFDKDYRNTNWWYAQIGIPEPLLESILLLGDDLPSQMFEEAKPILDRSKMGRTGQNKVWCAGIALMKGIIHVDSDKVQVASSAIWSELNISTDEGIQPDWSFHQHGAQLQFGNYGLWFGQSVVMWASILRDTPYALDNSELETLCGYLLNGPSWVMWNGLFDLGACARQIEEDCQLHKGDYLQAQLELMRDVDPKFASEYAKRLATPNELVGFRSYPRSDFAVQRTPDWYASLKMSSARLIGSENTNSENEQGLHLSDGMLLLARSGREYENIQPLWDWKRLPGTTCDQGLPRLSPSKTKSLSVLAGSLGDGKTGVAAMIYKRGGLEARKAWFFEKEAVVCLGAGIGGETQGSVYTSIQQSLLNSSVETSIGALGAGTHSLPKGAWVYHNGKGYHLKNAATLQTGAVEGNWKTLYPTRGDQPASENVFSLWVDHGLSPRQASYEYVLYPNIQASDMEQMIKTNQTKILSNTQTLQAIENAGRVQAVFYDAGRLRFGGGKVVETDAPCLLSLLDDVLFVADPTHKILKITVSVDGEETVVELPRGDYAGSKVRVTSN